MTLSRELMHTAEAERVNDAAGLRALETEWWGLWRRSGAGVFCSPAWLIPWWEELGGEGLRTIAVRRGGTLVGIVPLFVWRRSALLLGTGVSDYLGAVIEPGAEAEVVGAAVRELARDDSWDVCDWQALEMESPLLGSVATGWSDVTHVQEVCPVLAALPSRVEELGAVVPGHELAKLRYYRGRAARAGFQPIERATEQTVDEMTDALVRLHGLQWNGVGQAGVLADEKIGSFHRKAARRLERAGLLRLYALRQSSGEIAACLHAMNGGGRTCFYLSGFDPAIRQLSPGMLMIGHAIEEAVREGAAEFDFLRGSEPYKYAWGCGGSVDVPAGASPGRGGGA